MRVEPIIYSGELKNGLRIVHQRNDSPVAHLGLLINTGSRDERKNEQGLAHFIEHVIFKGTAKRKAYHILSRLDAVGGELNAFTTKEDTCIYGAFLTEYYERAIDLISDIILHSTFPEKELKKEKEVIVDEINSYMDSPSEQIFDDFEEQIFKGHPIGRNILGTIESVRSFTKTEIQNFISRNYAPSEMVLSSIGNVSFDEIVRLAELYFGQMEKRKNINKRKAFADYQPANMEVKRDTYQAHCIIGNIAYSAVNKKRYPLVLLNNILGGPAMNSRLNLSVRERHGYTYNIESSYTPYSDTGIVSIYMGTDLQSLEKTQALVHKELKKFREVKLGRTQLSQAKHQLTGQMALSQEHQSNLMITLGKCIMVYGKVDTQKKVYQQIGKITAEEIQDTANEIFDPNALSSLTYLPK